MHREKFGQKVGAFVLLGIGMMGAVVVVLGSRQDLFAKQYVLYAEFQDVAGLQPGAPIRLSGVDVGQVGEVTFPESGGGKSLRVKLQIRETVRERIRGDSVAAIATQGVLGDKYVSITLGTEGEAVAPGAVLPSEPPTDYSAIVDTAGNTMKHLESIATKFDELFAPGDGDATKKSAESVVQNLTASATDLRAAARDLRGIVAKVDRGEGTVGALINDPALYNDLRKLLGGAKKSTVLKMAVRHAVGKNEEPVPTETPKKDEGEATP